MSLQRAAMAYAGSDAFILDGPLVQVAIVPDCGGKIVSLRSHISGREWLWRDPWRQARRPDVDGNFLAGDLSGWDECFPTIAECAYPAEPTSALWGHRLPDHGELWSRPWSIVDANETLTLRLESERLPYLFERSATMTSRGALRLDYRLESRTDEWFSCLWSAHPLFAAAQGMRIHLPETAEMTKEFGIGGRIGADGDGSFGQFGIHHWPVVDGADGRRHDLSVIDLVGEAAADKVVVRGFAAGWAELCDPGSGEALRLEFPAERIPYLGICSNLGAVPAGERAGRWVAIEPASGGTDRLDSAVRRGEALSLPPRGVVCWTLDVSVHPCGAAACRKARGRDAPLSELSAPPRSAMPKQPGKDTTPDKIHRDQDDHQ